MTTTSQPCIRLWQLAQKTKSSTTSNDETERMGHLGFAPLRRLLELDVKLKGFDAPLGVFVQGGVLVGKARPYLGFCT